MRQLGFAILFWITTTLLQGAEMIPFGIFTNAENGVTQNISICANWDFFFDGESRPPVRFDQNFTVVIDCDTSELHSATFVNSFSVPADGTMTLGCGADWYFDFKVDGKTVYSTMKSGNGGCLFGRDNHQLRFPVSAGRHRVEVTLQNGTDGMRFVCGPALPPRRWDTKPVSLTELNAALAAVYAGNCFQEDVSRLAGMEVLQRSLNMISPQAYVDYCTGKQRPAPKTVPAFDWYDRAFRKVLNEVRTEKVEGDTVVLWLVYNMGYVIKTAHAVFAIDLCHRLATELAPQLDFAMITHNHGDHCDLKFINAMQQDGFVRGKPIISSFLPTRHYSKYPTTYTFGDITIRMGEVDHNRFLRNFVSPYEIICGQGKNACVIYHTGDSANAKQLRTSRPVDILIVHPRPAGEIHFAQEAAAVLHPKMLLISHLQELGHSFGPGRWTYADARAERKLAQAEAGRIGIPVWGEKIVWTPNK